MRKVLIALGVIQTKTINKDEFDVSRLNPYNPLSYMTVLIVLIISIICFGIIGFKEQIDLRNPFVWG